MSNIPKSVAPLPFPVNPILEHLPVYQPGRPIEEVARELGLPAESIIKLASNENPLGPSPAALAAMEKILGNLHLYPDGNAFISRAGWRKNSRLIPPILFLEMVRTKSLSSSATPSWDRAWTWWCRNTASPFIRSLPNSLAQI